MTEHVSLSAGIDIPKERGRVWTTPSLSIVSYVIFHVPCANFLTLDTTEVHCLVLRVIFNYFDDGEIIKQREDGR
jgi:hypothetical protein